MSAAEHTRDVSFPYFNSREADDGFAVLQIVLCCNIINQTLEHSRFGNWKRCLGRWLNVTLDQSIGKVTLCSS